jgi:hypothetical protein
MSAFYRLLGTRSPGGIVVEHDGLVAAVVPSCPNQSVVNGVVYEDAKAISAVHEELKALYATRGLACGGCGFPKPIVLRPSGSSGPGITSLGARGR